MFRVICFLLIANNNYAQISKLDNWCGTDAYYKQQVVLHPEILDIEIRINEYLAGIKNDTTNPLNKTSILLGVKKIPVVFHLIGDDVISSLNYGILLNQMNTLNNDFRKKLATTGYGTGVDVEIEFCFARKDPEGKESLGYVEVNGSFGAYNTGDNSMKSLSNWPSQNYLNVWVVKNIIGANGYATSPLLFATSPALDGIVMDKNYLFNIADPYIQGRNFTHEVGHWLGLKHPFTTDGTCGNADDCDDTPDAKDPFYSDFHSGCLAPNPSDPEYCPIASRQIENYMEYSTDPCKSKFTGCQKGYMRGYLEEIRFQIYDPSNLAGCDRNDSTTGNLGDLEPFIYCRYCNPRVYTLNIASGLKGSTSGSPRELIATNITAGGSGYHMTPNPTGKILLLADSDNDNATAPRPYGEINLQDGFYFYSSSDNEIEFKLCNLNQANPSWIPDPDKCGKYTDDPNPDDKDRNKRVAKLFQDSVFGVYIKPPQVSKSNQESVLMSGLKVNVFPNPTTTGEFNITDPINSNTSINYKIINSIGLVILSHTFTNSTTISLINQAKGIYQVVLFNSNTSITKTLIYN